MTLQEMIAAAQSRLDEAKGKDDAAATAKAEGELEALKSAESAGYTKTQEELNIHAGNARSEGKESGKKEARSEFLKSIGVSDEEDEEEVIKAVKEWRDGQKTEADRLKGEVDTHKETASTEKERADKAEAELKEMRTNEAISNALDAADFNGKRSHALRAVDRSQVKEEDGSFDASEAVKALSKDGFPGFGEPLNDPPNLERRRRKESNDGKSFARRRQDQKNKRQQEAG